MSGRNYPADTQKQKFLEESYNKERDTRLNWFYKRQKGSDGEATTGGSKQYQVFRKKIEGQHSKPAEELASKLPKIAEAKQYHRTIKDYSDHMAEQAEGLGNSTDLLTEMRPVTPKVRKSLYEGFSKDGTGRYQYLHRRYKTYNPEDKFLVPLLSSWEYGWRLGDVIKKDEIKKPTFGRTRIVADTFYTRTGIPGSQPTM